METDTSASGKKEGAIVGQPGAIWIASSGPGAERLLSEAAIPRNVAFVYLEPKIASVENAKRVRGELENAGLTIRVRVQLIGHL